MPHNRLRIRPTASHSAQLRAGLILCAALLSLSGCNLSSPYVHEWNYGQQSGNGAKSVNGVSVLAEMFREAGHKVRSWRVLSPSLEEADVIVWFADDFSTPSVDAQYWLDDWMRYNSSAKTLIYVSRDYESGPLYWKQTKPLAPKAQQPEFAKRARESESTFRARRGGSATTMGGGIVTTPTGVEAEDWFTLDRRNTKKRVTQLRGPWAAGVDASKTTIEHRRYLTPDESADTLLSDGDGHPLVSEIIVSADEYAWHEEDSRLIVIENGSFLLNASLVNKEHRKLAGKLIDHVGQPKLDVVFLESGASPPIQEKDPAIGPPTGFELFTIWPIGAVLAQIAALALVFAVARFPIFGVPRQAEKPALTDFGRHVAALGRLLAATRDRAYAKAQLDAYFNTDNKSSTSQEPNASEEGAR